LVSSFLVIPAATARLLGGTLFRMTIAAVLLGIAGSATGLVISFYVDIPSGATVILTLASTFAVALAYRAARRR
jgi:zinc transport system permease protein